MRIFPISLVLLVALACVACGGTTRKANGYYNNYGATMYNGTNFGTYAPGVGYNINNFGSVSNLSNMVASTLGLSCARLPDYVMTGTFVNNYTIAVSGGGATMAGNVSDIYVGRNSYGDLLIVAKIANGVQTVGYNVILSFCIDNKTFFSGSVVNGFATPNGIQLIANAAGAFGGAVAKNTQTSVSNISGIVPNSFVSVL
jgi:hypothetical protein